MSVSLSHSLSKRGKLFCPEDFPLLGNLAKHHYKALTPESPSINKCLNKNLFIIRFTLCGMVTVQVPIYELLLQKQSIRTSALIKAYCSCYSWKYCLNHAVILYKNNAYNIYLKNGIISNIR